MNLKDKIMEILQDTRDTFHTDEEIADLILDEVHKSLNHSGLR